MAGAACEVLSVPSAADGLRHLSTRVVAHRGRQWALGFYLDDPYTTEFVQLWLRRLYALRPAALDTSDTRQVEWVITFDGQRIDSLLTNTEVWLAIGDEGLPPSLTTPHRRITAPLKWSEELLALESGYWYRDVAQRAADALALLRRCSQDAQDGLAPLVHAFLTFENQLAVASGGVTLVQIEAWVRRAVQCAVCYSVTPLAMACTDPRAMASESQHVACSECHLMLMAKHNNSADYPCHICRQPGPKEPARPATGHALEEHQPACDLLAMLAEALMVLNCDPQKTDPLPAGDWPWQMEKIMGGFAQTVQKQQDWLLVLIGLDSVHRRELVQRVTASCITERLVLVTMESHRPAV